VYVVSGGRTRRVIVQIGHQTAQEAEVLDGLTTGAMVVVHPGDLVRDGARIKTRSQP
jgi:HlyD family secretion protein